MSVNRLKVVLCWHMHQPDYRGPANSDFKLPWVYLHGTKDYVDMAYHIEAHDNARAVVNFAPVLLEQIDAYVVQLEAWLERGERIGDPLLSALAGPGLPIGDEERRFLLDACLKANEQNLIDRFPSYRRLADMAKTALDEPALIPYLSDRFIADLLVWYHLAWMGEVPRNNDPRISGLEDKGRLFDQQDRRALIEAIHDILKGLIPRYRALAEAGKVELSTSPYAHPIVPLLLDIETTNEAMPDAALPKATEYPGGEPRARWHIRKGVETFEKHFGFRPTGCWPSEGAVSSQTVRILEEEGFSWAASGQAVLSNSLNSLHNGAPLPENWVHRPYSLAEGKTRVFFRDDGLSDLIGFTFSDWHADDAVGNLIQHLETIAEGANCDPDCVVSIILDGENAWEYYPKNGWYFLDSLYERLGNHPGLELTTFEESIQKSEGAPTSIPSLVAGSWVYGTFSTWIGDHDKNLGWDMLIDAKKAYDEALKTREFSPERIHELEMQLATCEGSDWFWWFGDYNPEAAVSDFEKLFRAQLTYLYSLLEIEPPAYLAKVFAHGSGAPAKGGVMRKS
jgi:alpha-amylase/alpha-mannosidase (GH57 family)